MRLQTITQSVALAVLFICQNGETKLAPDFIHPCNETTRACLVKATQDAIPAFVKGIPELGVPSLDPFVIEKLAIPLSGLKVTFYQGKVTGFRKCIVDNVVVVDEILITGLCKLTITDDFLEADKGIHFKEPDNFHGSGSHSAMQKVKQFRSELEKRHFVLDFHCNLTIKGQYDAIGKILLFNIDGAGDAKIKLTNLRMSVNINTKYIKDADGVNHFALRNYKYDFDYGDRVTFDLKNLFKGSQELSNTVLVFLNENWRTVAQEFGKPIVDYAVDLAINTIEKFFLAVPYEELIYVPLPGPE